MNFFRRKKHPRAISFCLTTVLWTGHEEKDIRWTGKIIGTDSRGLFHCAHLSRTQHRPIVCAQCCVPIKRSNARARDRPTSYEPAFPAVRLRRHSIFECHEKRISAKQRLSTIVPVLIAMLESLTRISELHRRSIHLSSIGRWQSARREIRKTWTMRDLRLLEIHTRICRQYLPISMHQVFRKCR